MNRSIREASSNSQATQVYKCEICKITVRSAQKLEDHIHFSPLHKATLHGTLSQMSVTNRLPTRTLSASPVRPIYSGQKLFWKINENLEVRIFEEVASDIITVRVLQAESGQAIKPLVLRRRHLVDAINTTGQIQWTDSHNDKKEVKDWIIKFILARIKAQKDSNQNITLMLDRSPQESYEPIILSSDNNECADSNQQPVLLANTQDQIQTAQNHVMTAAAKLQHARLQAETLSKLTRRTLESFDSRFTKSGQIT